MSSTTSRSLGGRRETTSIKYGIDGQVKLQSPADGSSAAPTVTGGRVPGDWIKGWRGRGGLGQGYSYTDFSGQ